MPRLTRVLVLVTLAPSMVACEGTQSALSPAGRDAEAIASLFWWMAGGAMIVWLLVIGLAVYAVVSKRERSRKAVQLFVVGGGALLPFVVLSGLLVFGLQMMPALLAGGREDGPRIRVVGHQWWWSIRYQLPDGSSFDAANEIRVAAGRRTTLDLESADVIHSLWVPSLAGKTDLIPGRVNQMAIEPTRTGLFRGMCAEYCGSSHAKMLIVVVVVEPGELDAWMEAQTLPARAPSGEVAVHGAELFASLGCGACHTVRGTHARGVIGPDLTHVGGRVDIGAGVLESDVAGFETWLRQTKHVKPDVHMPSFGMLPDADLHALAVYLEGLQ